MAQSIAHIGYWELDKKSGQFICSEEMYRILGLKPQVPMASYEAFLQTVHPDDRERVGKNFSEFMEGNCVDIEYRIVLQGGEVRVVHGKGEVLSLDASESTKVMGTIQEIRGHDQAKMLGVIQDITEQKELQNRLEEQVNEDFLTGCASRRHFLEQAGQEFSRIHRYGGDMSVLVLDLDHFKNVNDKHGHQVGDSTLKTLVKVCRVHLREVDIMGRLGGEEFAILLPETGSELALEVAERLCQAVAAAEVPLEGSPPLHFTTSIGVASLTKDDPRMDVILNRADRALYKAKNAGRNRASA